ncbi:Uncharacterised protein [Staphylococcus gallinarum]|uniref:Uncharacterized protein n=1 Tax=Staphylococcus gallinarum TaxID=1293 RepID=A0A380FMB9_STAGA|nr:Uncharacterised protein [Staphylococcus gallinarum]
MDLILVQWQQWVRKDFFKKGNLQFVILKMFAARIKAWLSNYQRFRRTV